MATTIPEELLNEVISALGPAINPGLSTETAASDLFEAYAFTIVISAAQVEGATVSYRGPDDRPTNELTFRTSPGYLWSTSKPYTFALIQFREVEELEAHVGVRVAGKSKVLHELDVCVLSRSEALTSQLNKVHPRSSKVVLGIECKFYTTPLGLVFGRAFLGLGDDVTAGNTFFLTNTASDSIEQLLSHRKRRWERNVYPGSNVDVVRARNAFQSVFKDFKAKKA